MKIIYEKSVYQAKITQLEGLHAQLDTHLANMETLRNKLFNFWDDKNAQDAVKLLNSEIREVKRVMTQTALEIFNLKNIVEKLGGLQGKQEQEIDNAFRAIEVVADIIPM